MTTEDREPVPTGSVDQNLLENGDQPQQDKKGFYLVEASALPEVYHKVLAAKELLDSGGARSVSEAVGKTGLSRSAFYKYKDMVFTFHEKSRARVLSLTFTLRDEPGVVSGLLNIVAQVQCNVLTLHQGLPSGGTATFSISVETQSAVVDNDEIIRQLSTARGVLEFKVLGSE